MKIFTRYMAKRFFAPFFVGLGMFALLIFLGDMFDKMGYLVKSKANLPVIVEYLWLGVPYWTIRVIPMATLLATLVALTGFIQSGEWIAVQASGFKTKAFWMPILWCSLAVTAVSFAAQETILPACYRRSVRLWREQIHPEWEWERYEDITLIGGSGQFIQAKLFLPKDGVMRRPLLERVTHAGVVSQLDAQSARWNAKTQSWDFFNGVERTFTDGAVRESVFSKKESDLKLPPRQMIPRTRKPDEMSILEIREYARQTAHLGESTRELRVAAYTKLAYPFTNFVICALGIPVALKLRRAGKAFTFFTALGVSFLFLWVMEVGRALGNSGTVPPMAAAWTANVLFAALALTLLRRSDI